MNAGKVSVYVSLLFLLFRDEFGYSCKLIYIGKQARLKINKRHKKDAKSGEQEAIVKRDSERCNKI